MAMKRATSSGVSGRSVKAGRSSGRRGTGRTRTRGARRK